MGRKIAFVGGGGVRTPLVVFGINEAVRALDADQFVLFDPDAERAQVVAALGRALVAREGGTLRIRQAATIEDAVEGASFVLNSIRVGGMQARIHDERVSVAHGYPGQETTGPGGVAMALRTVGVAVAQARLVERLSPTAWIINFTNPAGLITQAVTQNSNAKIVGICDTPSELLHQINLALGAGPEEVRCDYIGLNHLGWIRRIVLRGQDVTGKLLEDDDFLRRLYHVPLFDPDLIRSLRLIPTEYLYFYYSRRRALENQRNRTSTRGAEIERLGGDLFVRLARLLREGDDAQAISTYVDYLNARSGSYMKLEGEGDTAPSANGHLDPFRAATGYHRIALEVMTALCGNKPRRIIVNTQNSGSIADIDRSDIVEVPSLIGGGSITPEPCGDLPDAVRGLVLAVKAYERAAIEAALSGSDLLARKAMLLYPAIGEWEPSQELLEQLIIHC
jgi:6-phospho-beta-glucosidase